MCGIVSIFNYKDPSGIDRDEVRNIRDHMSPRGPDGSGEWYSTDNRIGLGHRRLAIIDLSAAAVQPMRNHDASLIIVFNGEIYNYKTLRVFLEKRGYAFRSSSDTEVLLHLYDAKGPDMLHDLRGMFAFVIWDDRKKELFLARDPFGIKPLYYSENGNTFIAASQVKALLKSPKIDTSPDPAGHSGFFLWGHVPEPFTLYNGIHALPAGSYMVVDNEGSKVVTTYCNPSSLLSSAKSPPRITSKEEMKGLLRSAMLDTVRSHLVADVPVGVFLSAGIDSTTLVALASEISGSGLKTVTLGFNEYINMHDDETALAALVAGKYSTGHHTIWVSRKDFQNDINGLFKAMDQPSIDGVNSYFVSKAAAKAGFKVAISGLGGDEIFGSYPSFAQIPKMVKLLGPLDNIRFIGKVFQVVSSFFLNRMTSPKYAGLLEYGRTFGGAYLLRRGMYMPWELPYIIEPEMAREGWEKLQTLLRLEQTFEGVEDAYAKVAALEMSWYMRNQLLRDTDWASMAHSIEIRVPFLDIEFLKTIAPYMADSSHPTKLDMASVPLNPLPEEILKRGKTGFSIPVKEWVRQGEEEDPSSRGLRKWAMRVYEHETTG